MNISIISVGKIKEKYFKDAISEYEKRLKPYVKLKIFEVNSSATSSPSSFFAFV